MVIIIDLSVIDSAFIFRILRRSDSLQAPLHSPCSKKVSPLMFDNNFGKCGPIFKILSPVELDS